MIYRMKTISARIKNASYYRTWNYPSQLQKRLDNFEESLNIQAFPNKGDDFFIQKELNSLARRAGCWIFVFNAKQNNMGMQEFASETRI